MTDEQPPDYPNWDSEPDLQPDDDPPGEIGTVAVPGHVPQHDSSPMPKHENATVAQDDQICPQCGWVGTHPNDCGDPAYHRV